MRFLTSGQPRVFHNRPSRAAPPRKQLRASAPLACAQVSHAEIAGRVREQLTELTLAIGIIVELFPAGRAAMMSVVALLREL